MVVESDSLTKRHEEDFARFKRSVRKGPFRPLVALFGVLVLAYLFFAPHANRQELQDYQFAREALLSTQTHWAAALVETHILNRSWLVVHGIPAEVRLYDWIGCRIFNAAFFAAGYYNQTGFRGYISRALVSAYAPLLRVFFVVVACWRLWLAALMIAVLWGVLSITPYRAPDLLGQTGNGRLFFSGIKAGLVRPNTCLLYTSPSPRDS